MIRSSGNFELYWCVYKISCSEQKHDCIDLSVLSLFWFTVILSTSTASNKCRNYNRARIVYIYICLIIKYVCALLFIYSFWFFILFLFLLSCQSGISFTQISGTSICIIWFFAHNKWQEMNIHVRTALVIYNFTF